MEQEGRQRAWKNARAHSAPSLALHRVTISPSKPCFNHLVFIYHRVSIFISLEVGISVLILKKFSWYLVVMYYVNAVRKSRQGAVYCLLLYHPFGIEVYHRHSYIFVFILPHT